MSDVSEDFEQVLKDQEQERQNRDAHDRTLKDNIKVLGSHWNRNTIKNAEVKWNPSLGKWEVEITRHLGFFDSAAEAGHYLTSYMNSTEDWFLYRLENGEGALQIMGVKMYERYLQEPTVKEKEVTNGSE